MHHIAGILDFTFEMNPSQLKDFHDKYRIWLDTFVKQSVLFLCGTYIRALNLRLLSVCPFLKKWWMLYQKVNFHRFLIRNSWKSITLLMQLRNNSHFKTFRIVNKIFHNYLNIKTLCPTGEVDVKTYLWKWNCCTSSRTLDLYIL